MAKNHGSTAQDDEQYEALRDKGASKQKAARIANSGKDASKRGGKASKYEDQTKDKLMKRAKEIGIEGRSQMDEGELISALRKG